MRSRRSRSAAVVLCLTLGALAAGCDAMPGSAVRENAVTSVASSTTEPEPAGERDVDISISRLAFEGSDEASGLAASVTTPGAFFLVDDATGTSEIVAVAADGTLLARIDVAGMSAGNAEALAAGPCGTTSVATGAALPAEGPCLYVGDIGDHVERPAIAVYRLAEPPLDGSDATVPAPADAWRYTYPDDPRDAEAMLVDADGSVLIIAKPDPGDGPVEDPVDGTIAHRMYRGRPGGGTLEFVREFRPPEPPLPLLSALVGNVVTDAASSPGRVLVLTYDQVLEYRAPAPGPGGSVDLAGFPDWPSATLARPALGQTEGIAAAADGCGYAIAAEAGPAGGTATLAVATCR